MKLMILYGVLAVVVLSGLVDAADPWDATSEQLTYMCTKNTTTNVTTVTLQYGPTRSAYYAGHTVMTVTRPGADIDALLDRADCTETDQDADTETVVAISASTCSSIDTPPPTDNEDIEVTFFSNETVSTAYNIRFQFTCDFAVADQTAQYNSTGITFEMGGARNGSSKTAAGQITGTLTVIDSNGDTTSVLTIGDNSTYRLVVNITLTEPFQSISVVSVKAVVGTATAFLVNNGAKEYPGQGNSPWVIGGGAPFTTIGGVATSGPINAFTMKQKKQSTIVFMVDVLICRGTTCPSSRRRRSASDDDDESEVKEFSVTLNLFDERRPETSNIIEEKKDAPEPRVVPCWQSTEFIAIVVVLVALLLISISISCFSVIRARNLYVNNKPV